ncbi:type I toxin-antitoxin system Ibs family toxin [Klebsiella aerogenes]
MCRTRHSNVSLIKRRLNTVKPLREGALNKERVMMNLVIILVILLVISLPAY